MSKLYEIPEDVAKVLRNVGFPVLTKHYIEEQEGEKLPDLDVPYQGNKPEDGVATSRIPAHLTERQPKRKKHSKYQKIVEVGSATPKELNLHKGRRFYGEKAQALLLQRKHGMKRGALSAALYNGDRYHADDNQHTIACQITNLVKLGVLSYKESN